MRGQHLEPGPHQSGDALADAEVRQLRGVDPHGHLAVGPALEMNQQIVAAAREQAPREAGVHAEIGRGREQRAPAPAVEGHVRERRLEQPVALHLAARAGVHASSSGSPAPGAGATCLSSLSKAS